MKLYVETTGPGLDPSAHYLAPHTTHLMLVCAGTKIVYPSSGQSPRLVNTTEPLIPDMQANTHHLSTPNLPPQYSSVLSSPNFLPAIPFHLSKIPIPFYHAH